MALFSTFQTPKTACLLGSWETAIRGPKVGKMAKIDDFRPPKRPVCWGPKVKDTGAPRPSAKITLHIVGPIEKSPFIEEKVRKNNRIGAKCWKCHSGTLRYILYGPVNPVDPCQLAYFFRFFFLLAIKASFLEHIYPGRQAIMNPIKP